ncbi:hypothetical protein BDP27DRAFT_1364901 [Rhodocollybia butyracea]|uniref:C2H2-type domain-containing protein n=1 Tax=Rhodocollybia butyracea TaxID=206335 RepID=A0A9P5PQ65_9AGAR|nr:hypothetical protein BDP27DRAFT_1364901 [Rhodocollybia butyracea]
MSTTGYSYCAQHDMYFVDHQDRDQHIQSSSDHAQCDLCDRRFLNKNTLRNHWVYAEHHYYCWECDKHFKSAPGLQYHLDEVHIGDDDDDSDEECSCYQSDESDNWEDDRGAERYPDGIPSETLAHKKGVNDDNSWEDLDDLDFEDEEDLVDPPTQWATNRVPLATRTRMKKTRKVLPVISLAPYIRSVKSKGTAETRLSYATKENCTFRNQKSQMTILVHMTGSRRGECEQSEALVQAIETLFSSRVRDDLAILRILLTQQTPTLEMIS